MRRHLLAAFLLLSVGSTEVRLVAQVPSPARPVELAVSGMPVDAPLAVTAAHDGVVLRVLVNLQPGWHLYGRDTGGGQPVAMELGAGAFAAAGPLQVPMDKEGLITGDAELKLPLRRVAGGEGLAATMHFMVCDALQCLPPITLKLATADGPAAAPLAPAKVLLVAIDESERTQRIAAFLTERGFLPTVTTDHGSCHGGPGAAVRGRPARCRVCGLRTAVRHRLQRRQRDARTGRDRRRRAGPDRHARVAEPSAADAACVRTRFQPHRLCRPDAAVPARPADRLDRLPPLRQPRSLTAALRLGVPDAGDVAAVGAAGLARCDRPLRAALRHEPAVEPAGFEQWADAARAAVSR